MDSLHVTTIGESGPRIAFLHGLFGQGRNWTRIAKELSSEFSCTMVDLPNHGQSPWTESLSYIEMAKTVAAQLRSISTEPWIVLGHSMGGKTAMLLALLEPELVRALIVVDISPVDYHGLTSFKDYVTGMLAMPLDQVHTRADADEFAKEWVDDPSVRSFLLQNLRRAGEGWRWAANLNLIAKSLDQLGGWPGNELPPGATYGGPVLWIVGGASSYVKPKYAETMRELFPHTRLVTLKGSGHWPHSQLPEVFLSTIRPFVRAVKE
ncbi:alpha/beta fold hydrolase [Calidifontibacter terrae]